MNCGIIHEVYMENFMCHKRLRLEFNKRINFINGPNGSGKSAILAALQVWCRRLDEGVSVSDSAWFPASDSASFPVSPIWTIGKSNVPWHVSCGFLELDRPRPFIPVFNTALKTRNFKNSQFEHLPRSAWGRARRTRTARPRSATW